MSSEHLGRSHGRRSPCCPCAAVAPAPPLCLAPQTSRGYRVWSCNFNFVGNINGKGCVAGALLRGAGPKGIWLKWLLYLLLRTRSFCVFLQLLAQQAISILDRRIPCSQAFICTEPLVACSNLSFLHIDGGHQQPKVQSRDVHHMSMSRQPIYRKGTSDAKLADSTLFTEHKSKQKSRVSQYIVPYSVGVLRCIMLYVWWMDLIKLMSNKCPKCASDFHFRLVPVLSWLLVSESSKSLHVSGTGSIISYKWRPFEFTKSFSSDNNGQVTALCANMQSFRDGHSMVSPASHKSKACKVGPVGSDPIGSSGRCLDKT